MRTPFRLSGLRGAIGKRPCDQHRAPVRSTSYWIPASGSSVNTSCTPSCSAVCHLLQALDRHTCIALRLVLRNIHHGDRQPLGKLQLRHPACDAGLDQRNTDAFDRTRLQ